MPIVFPSQKSFRLNKGAWAWVGGERCKAWTVMRKAGVDVQGNRVRGRNTMGSDSLVIDVDHSVGLGMCRGSIASSNC